jgi:hypothetical protein
LQFLALLASSLGKIVLDVMLVTEPWFGEEVREMTIFSEQYDFTVSLLLLEDPARYIQLEPDPEEDTYDRFMREK